MAVCEAGGDVEEPVAQRLGFGPGAAPTPALTGRPPWCWSAPPSTSATGPGGVPSPCDGRPLSPPNRFDAGDRQKRLHAVADRVVERPERDGCDRSDAFVV